MRYRTTVALFMFLSLSSTCLAGFEAILLKEQSDVNKSQQRGLVCFDANGKVDTFGTHFKECRRVAIRELAQ